MNKRIFSLLFIFTVTASSFANISFRGIQRYANPRWDGSGKYDTVYYENQAGTIELKSISIETRPHGSYLEVTENTSISLYASQNDIVSKWIIGTLTLPLKSAIVSFTLYKDTTTYSGIIYPSQKKNYPIDTLEYAPKATIQYDQQVVYGNQSIDNYTVRIDSVGKDIEYRIKIRYLIPNNSRPSVSYPLSVLMSSDKNPGNIEFLFNKGTQNKNYVLVTSGMKFQLSNSQSIQLPYQNSFQINVVDSSESVLHITDFADGNWKGKYLLLNTSIPDSVMSKLSKSMELVVLWRWNKPTSFMTKHYYYGSDLSEYRTISSYGELMLQQAEAIKYLINDCASAGSKTGLVHSIAHKKPEVFKLATKNSPDFALMNDYLSTFTYDYLQTSNYFENDFGAQPFVDTLSDSSRVEFLKSMNIVHGLYSNGTGIMKHLVIVTCGPVRVSRNVIAIEEIDSLINNLSVDCSNALWTDVNFSQIKNSALQRPLVTMDGSFFMPQFKPASILLNVSNQTKSYSFPLASDCQSFSIIAKSQTSWNPVLSWTGYDSFGNIMSTASSTGSVFTGTLDTGLVKLWAVNSSRLNDQQESDIGTQYGVLNSETIMKMYPSLNKTDSGTFATVEKRYNYNYSGVTTGTNLLHEIYACTFSNGFLKVTFPSGKAIHAIKIFSLSGALLAEINPEQFNHNGEYLIPASKFLHSMNSSRMIVVRIEGSGIVKNYRLVI